MSPRALLLLAAWASRAQEAAAGCGCDQWFEAYGGERCYNDGDHMVLKCEANNGAQCGARLSSGDALGVGVHSLTLKAIPGSGAATTFYLSTNAEGMYRPEQGGWNEIDFEILGLQAGPTTKIWTNLFTGTAEEHHEMIEVPFDVSADFHTYTIEITETEVKWLVDWKEYRTMDYTSFGDMTSAVQESRFKRFLSVWGKASYEPLGACQEFTDALGQLDDNPGPFPLLAEFAMGVPERPAKDTSKSGGGGGRRRKTSEDDEGSSTDDGEATEEDASAGESSSDADEASEQATDAESSPDDDKASGEASEPTTTISKLEKTCKNFGCVHHDDPAAECQCAPTCKSDGSCCKDYDDACGGPAAVSDAAVLPSLAPPPSRWRRCVAVAASLAASLAAISMVVRAVRRRRRCADLVEEDALLLSAVEAESSCHH